MHVVKPPYHHYVLNGLDEHSYTKYATVYSNSKRWGVKGIYVFLGGTGLVGVVKGVAQGTVVQYGKRRLATVVVGACSYVAAPAIAVITNSTRVVKTCKVIYTTIGYVMEACEDASQVTFLPLDLLLFGQTIPANKEGRYSSWSDMKDLIDNLPFIGDS